MASSEPDKEETLVTLEVPAGYTELERLDVYLTNKLPNVSRARVQTGIKEGAVSINGKPVKKASYRVQAGDVLDCIIMKPPPIEALPEDIPVDIVYEDDALLVVNKEAGMVVHPAYGNRTGTLVNALLYYLGADPIRFDESEDEENEDEPDLDSPQAWKDAREMARLRPGIVHRLDKDTSGLLVVAKTDSAHTALAHQFMNRTIHRRYLALLWGVPREDEGTIETYVGRDPRDRKKIAVVKEDRGKLAITHFKIQAHYIYTCLAEFRLETGRTHQIRVHARHMGHPILGDTTYDGNRIRYGPQTRKRKVFFSNLFSILPRQALHARSLGFDHPVTGEKMYFECELPQDMQTVREKLEEIDQIQWN